MDVTSSSHTAPQLSSCVFIFVNLLFQELFKLAAEEPDRNWSFSVAVLEIYNEAVHDLLAVAAAAATHGPSSMALAAETAKASLDVSGLAAGDMPPGMDR